MHTSKLQPGDKAPAFKALDQHGTSIQLKDLKGKKVVLYFYPKDNTPTCTVEACNFRDNHHALIKAGYVVLGVSADSAKRHQNFSEKFDLPFSLLVDDQKIIIDAYDVWGPKKFMGKVNDSIHRTTFVIDEKGAIAHVVRKVTSKTATEQILSLEA